MTTQPQPSSAPAPDARPPTGAAGAVPANSKEKPGRLRFLIAAGLAALFVAALVWAAPEALPLRAAEPPIPGCSELVVNGGFETPGEGWSIMPGTPQAMYTNQRFFEDGAFENGGQMSMLAGNLNSPNVEGASTFEQTIALPANPNYLLLSFWTYGVIDGPLGAGDLQYVDVIDAATDTRLQRVLETQEGDAWWKRVAVDLTPYGSRTITLVFGVGNDGFDGRIALFVDAVSIIHCPSGAEPEATPTSIIPTVSPGDPIGPSVVTLPPPPTSVATLPVFPTVWPSPPPTYWGTPPPTVWFTPAPTLPPPVYPTTWPPVVTPFPTPFPTAPQPGQCNNILVNGSFEQSGGWEFGRSPVPGIISRPIGNFGQRGAQLGNPPSYMPDVLSFSSVRQLVTIPASAGSAYLSWWAVFGSQEPFAESIAIGADRQELILLEPDLSTKQVLFRIRRVDQAIQEIVTDLTPFVGQSFYIYFNVFNDGNGRQSWMMLDNVQLCVGAVPIQPLGSQGAAPMAAAQSGGSGGGAGTGGAGEFAAVAPGGSAMVPRDPNNAPDGFVIPTSTVVPQVLVATPAPIITPLGAPQGDVQGEAPAATIAAEPEGQTQSRMVAANAGAQNEGPGPVAIAVTLGGILLVVSLLVVGVVRAISNSEA